MAEIGAAGGRAATDAKGAAARTNGKLGGRPHRPIFDASWTLTDRHGTDDPPMNVSLLGVVPGPTHAAGAPQVLEDSFFREPRAWMKRLR